MSLSRKEIFILALTITLGIGAVLPIVAAGESGLGSGANIACLPNVDPTCPCMKKMNPKTKKCDLPDPSNRWQCPCKDMTSGFPTDGKCFAPGQCKALSTGGKDGFGLDQVAKILGDLMSKLMQSGKENQNKGDAPTTPAQAPTCSISSGVVSSNESSTTARLTWQSFFYDSARTAVDAGATVSISPDIGSVEQSGSRDVTVSTATTYTMTVSGAGGTGTCSTTVIGLGGDGGDNCGILGCEGDPDPENPDQATGQLTATPTSGEAPLTVDIAFQVSKEGRYSISFGDQNVSEDGEPFDIELLEGRCVDGTNFGACSLEGQVRHVFEEPGTYAVVMYDKEMQETICTQVASLSCGVLDTVSVNVLGEEDTGDDDDPVPTSSLTARPISGTVPLTVEFTGTSASGGYTIEFGDGKSVSAGCSHGGCTGVARAVEQEHVYATVGTFTAKLRRHFNSNEANCSGADCNVVDTTTITVRASTTATSTKPVPVFSNVAFLLPGVRGDIVTIQSGGTVLAGFRDQAKNTEISGFYGSYTFNEPPQGIVSRLCQARPWAGGFLSFIVPATFFDSLCSSRGYQVGLFNQQQQTQANVPNVVVTQTQPKNTTKATSTTPRPATTTTAVQGRVRIWAVPATVPLGSRTSIFWTSQGVTSCLVSSPDGSFTQSSLSGGASTVPITTATTYSISCLQSDGTPVTGYTTVTISI